jgi:lipopolysaccharide/colanic/teichoic acid biosynthesis glycosyltransferase
MTQEVLFVATDATSRESISPLVGLEMHAVSQLTPLLDQYAGRIEAVVLYETSRELPSIVAEKLRELHFAGTSTYTLELFHEVYWRKIPLYRLNQMWLFQEGFQIARDPVFERLKRLSDIVLSLLGLVLSSPLLLLCAAAVWLEDRGPVFYLQTRVGKNRAAFQIYKFRTMRPGAAQGDLYTRPNDHRITRVGRLLRAMRFDEFPQLWNVLRGDMSLIGPRAEWIQLVERYEREIPCYDFRHLVKPGITGWAQVNYPYGANLDDTLRKLEYDLYYIRYFSFTLDASIVLKTIHIMLFGKGR